MKLLFDQNLSHRLVKSFATEFPGSAHVRHVGLEKAPDGPVWDYAKQNGFVIVRFCSLLFPSDRRERADAKKFGVRA